MKTITIGFSRSKKKFAVGSWLIRKYMKTNYSHVYVKFRSESLDRSLVYEAVGSGVRFIGQKMWETHAEEVASFDIQLDDRTYVKVMQFCVDNSGNDYGFMQNVGIPLSLLLGLKSNPFQSGDNCSELILLLLKSCGYIVPKNKDLVMPRDVYEVLSPKSTL